MNKNLLEMYPKEKDLKKYENASLWATAIGLQKVDGLQVSDYLIKLAIKNIEGELTLDEVDKLIKEHYKKNK